MPFSVFNFEEFLKLEGKGGGEKNIPQNKARLTPIPSK